MSSNLLMKYNVQGPRYTSYPTVPYWETNPSVRDWMEALTHRFSLENRTNGISLYIHIPYCESLCTYCACNTRITVNHKVEGPYVDTIIREWKMYRALMDEKPVISEIHLGGGTPTFLSADNLERMISGILEDAEVHPDHEFSLEAHPSYTTAEQLERLAKLGFNRISFGIQDFDVKVQEMINRYQSFEEVKAITEISRASGFHSVNYDLIYGLPGQTLESIISTVDLVRELDPDRIAFYSFALVPWKKPGHRKFTDADVPMGPEKLKLYEKGREMLNEAGYRDIGMDHFAKESDSMYKALLDGSLHRNFMGYTTTRSKLLLGLGVSSISDSWDAFIQNEKVVERYMERVNKGELPFYRGHLLNHEDQVIRRHILNLMCKYETSWNNPADYVSYLSEAKQFLLELGQDKIIELMPQGIRISDEGRPFLRNVCMALDARLKRKQPDKQVFSKVI